MLIILLVQVIISPSSFIIIDLIVLNMFLPSLKIFIIFPVLNSFIYFMCRVMNFTDSETQPPEDVPLSQMEFSGPHELAPECNSFKWKVKIIGKINIL